jgi:integrase
MQYLTTPELAKLFRVMHAGNKNHHLAALTAFWTGARVSQVLSLEGQDIFEAKGQMVVKIHAAKRGNERLHTLHLDADPAFDMSPLLAIAKMRQRTRLFGGLSRQYLNLCLKEACAEAGLHTDFGHMHVFRHSVAMQIWEGTQRLGAISEFLQHRSPATALCYLAENDGRMAQEAVDAVRFA